MGLHDAPKQIGTRGFTRPGKKQMCQVEEDEGTQYEETKAQDAAA
jgi:hypothetical protein